MTTIATLPRPMVDPTCLHCAYGSHVECSACGCEWRRDVEARNEVTEADCAGCSCHSSVVAL